MTGWSGCDSGTTDGRVSNHAPARRAVPTEIDVPEIFCETIERPKQNTALGFFVSGVIRFAFILVDLPENDNGALLALADASAKLVSLLQRQPEWRDILARRQ